MTDIEELVARLLAALIANIAAHDELEKAQATAYATQTELTTARSAFEAMLWRKAKGE